MGKIGQLLPFSTEIKGAWIYTSKKHLRVYLWPGNFFKHKENITLNILQVCDYESVTLQAA